MKHELRCDCCNEVLTMLNFNVTYGVVKTKTCNSCTNEYVDTVKRMYYVETYNNHDIYKKDGMYYPYWDCQYCFDNLQDCKDRIDAKVGIYFF